MSVSDQPFPIRDSDELAHSLYDVDDDTAEERALAARRRLVQMQLQQQHTLSLQHRVMPHRRGSPAAASAASTAHALAHTPAIERSIQEHSSSMRSSTSTSSLISALLPRHDTRSSSSNSGNANPHHSSSSIASPSGLPPDYSDATFSSLHGSFSYPASATSLESASPAPASTLVAPVAPTAVAASPTSTSPSYNSMSWSSSPLSGGHSTTPAHALAPIIHVLAPTPRAADSSHPAPPQRSSSRNSPPSLIRTASSHIPTATSRPASTSATISTTPHTLHPHHAADIAAHVGQSSDNNGSNTDDDDDDDRPMFPDPANDDDDDNDRVRHSLANSLAAFHRAPSAVSLVAPIPRVPSGIIPLVLDYTDRDGSDSSSASRSSASPHSSSASSSSSSSSSSAFAPSSASSASSLSAASSSTSPMQAMHAASYSSSSTSSSSSSMSTRTPHPIDRGSSAFDAPPFFAAAASSHAAAASAPRAPRASSVSHSHTYAHHHAHAHMHPHARSHSPASASSTLHAPLQRAHLHTLAHSPAQPSPQSLVHELATPSHAHPFPLDALAASSAQQHSSRSHERSPSPRSHAHSSRSHSRSHSNTHSSSPSPRHQQYSHHPHHHFEHADAVHQSELPHDTGLRHHSLHHHQHHHHHQHQQHPAQPSSRHRQSHLADYLRQHHHHQQQQQLQHASPDRTPRAPSTDSSSNGSSTSSPHHPASSRTTPLHIPAIASAGVPSLTSSASFSSSSSSSSSTTAFSSSLVLPDRLIGRTPPPIVSPSGPHSIVGPSPATFAAGHMSSLSGRSLPLQPRRASASQATQARVPMRTPSPAFVHVSQSALDLPVAAYSSDAVAAPTRSSAMQPRWVAASMDQPTYLGMHPPHSFASPHAPESVVASHYSQRTSPSFPPRRSPSPSPLLAHSVSDVVLAEREHHHVDDDHATAFMVDSRSSPALVRASSAVQVARTPAPVEAGESALLRTRDVHAVVGHAPPSVPRTQSGPSLSRSCTPQVTLLARLMSLNEDDDSASCSSVAHAFDAMTIPEMPRRTPCLSESASSTPALPSASAATSATPPSIVCASSVVAVPSTTTVPPVVAIPSVPAMPPAGRRSSAPASPATRVSAVNSPTLNLSSPTASSRAPAHLSPVLAGAPAAPLVLATNASIPCSAEPASVPVAAVVAPPSESAALEVANANATVAASATSTTQAPLPPAAATETASDLMSHPSDSQPSPATCSVSAPQAVVRSSSAGAPTATKAEADASGTLTPSSSSSSTSSPSSPSSSSPQLVPARVRHRASPHTLQRLASLPPPNLRRPDSPVVGAIAPSTTSNAVASPPPVESPTVSATGIAGPHAPDAVTDASPTNNNSNASAAVPVDSSPPAAAPRELHAQAFTAPTSEHVVEGTLTMLDEATRVSIKPSSSSMPSAALGASESSVPPSAPQPLAVASASDSPVSLSAASTAAETPTRRTSSADSRADSRAESRASTRHVARSSMTSGLHASNVSVSATVDFINANNSGSGGGASVSNSVATTGSSSVTVRPASHHALTPQLAPVDSSEPARVSKTSSPKIAVAASESPVARMSRQVSRSNLSLVTTGQSIVPASISAVAPHVSSASAASASASTSASSSALTQTQRAQIASNAALPPDTTQQPRVYKNRGMSIAALLDAAMGSGAASLVPESKSPEMLSLAPSFSPVAAATARTTSVPAHAVLPASFSPTSSSSSPANTVAAPVRDTVDPLQHATAIARDGRGWSSDSVPAPEYYQRHPERSIRISADPTIADPWMHHMRIGARLGTASRRHDELPRVADDHNATVYRTAAATGDVLAQAAALPMHGYDDDVAMHFAEHWEEVRHAAEEAQSRSQHRLSLHYLHDHEHRRHPRRGHPHDRETSSSSMMLYDDADDALSRGDHATMQGAHHEGDICDCGEAFASGHSSRSASPSVSMSGVMDEDAENPIDVAVVDDGDDGFTSTGSSTSTNSATTTTTTGGSATDRPVATAFWSVRRPAIPRAPLMTPGMSYAPPTRTAAPRAGSGTAASAASAGAEAAAASAGAGVPRAPSLISNAMVLANAARSRLQATLSLVSRSSPTASSSSLDSSSMRGRGAQQIQLSAFGGQHSGDVDGIDDEHDSGMLDPATRRKLSRARSRVVVRNGWLDSMAQWFRARTGLGRADMLNGLPSAVDSSYSSSSHSFAIDVHDNDNGDDEDDGDGARRDHRASNVNGSTADDDDDLSAPLDSALTLNQLSELARKRRVRRETSMLDLYSTKPINIDGLDVKEAKVLFLKMLGKGLYTTGLPMHVVEFYLTLAGERLGQTITVVSLQTCLWISFGNDTTCHLIRPEHAGLSLSKMSDMCVVSESIALGTTTYENAVFNIQRIASRRGLWPSWMFLPAMTLISALCAPMFDGGWLEMLLAGIGGLIIGLFEVYTPPSSALNRGHELISGLICAVLAVLVQSYVAETYVLAAVFGGIIWLLPGLRVTLAMIDISTGNHVTGTAKLMSAIFTCLNLGVGIVLGLQVWHLTGTESVNIFAQTASPMPTWFVFLMVVLANLPNCILLDGHPSHLPQFIVGGTVAFTVSLMLAETTISSTMSQWLAALAIGVISNLYGRFTPYPAVELALFSIIMLVPGSRGVKSILASDTVTSVNFFFQMIQLALALVLGLFAANVVVPPPRAM